MTEQTFADFRATAITDIDALAKMTKLNHVELYMVYALGKASFISKYIVKDDLFDFSKDDCFINDPEIFARFNHIWVHEENYSSSHCLGDMNLDKTNNGNQHLCFLNKNQADKYIEWCKINTSAPEQDYIEDHDHEDYDYEDYDDNPFRYD